MKLRARFKKKKIERQIPFEEKVRKIKRKKIYVKEKCHYVDENGKRCTRNCIGSGQLCKLHGGEKDLTNVLSAEAVQLMIAEVGKITKFDPSIHPLQMIDLSRQGMSGVEVAATLGVSEGTLKNWAEKYETFSVAYEIGQALHETWWIQQGKGGLNSKFFNTGLFKFLTANKLGYAEKVETKNMNMNVSGVLVVPEKQSMDEWEAAGVDNGKVAENKKEV